MVIPGYPLELKMTADLRMGYWSSRDRRPFNIFDDENVVGPLRLQVLNLTISRDLDCISPPVQPVALHHPADWAGGAGCVSPDTQFLPVCLFGHLVKVMRWALDGSMG